MSVEIHYLERIANANEQLSREIRELSIVLQEATKLLVVIAKNTKKEEVVIDNVFTKVSPVKKIAHYNEVSEEETQFSKEYLQYLFRESEMDKE